MPRLYKRKEGVQARVISWTTEQLQSAFEEIDKNKLGINEISRRFGIPPRTLRRRYATRNKTKLTQGKHPVLGFDNERKLVALILKLCDAGFPPNKLSIRILAYHFAEKMEIKHNFDKKLQMAGQQWLKSFTERNSDLFKQTRYLFEDRDKSTNGTKESRNDLKSEELNKFHELLITVLRDNNLMDKPERIYNMDEIIVQFNNKSENNVAYESAKLINSLTSESDAKLTLVACCNVIGNFLPPVIIMKGMNKQTEFQSRLPFGSKVYMNKKSAYINTDLFYKWFTEHFIDLKPRGKVLLILDEHSSHSSAPDLLQIAFDNDIVLLCLPTHSTLPFQPIDIAVLKPFETFFNNETNEFMSKNPNKKLSPYNVGIFINNAWVHVATPTNAIKGFRKSEIYPLKYNNGSASTLNVHSSYDDYEQLLEQNGTKSALPQLSFANENREPYIHVKIEPKTEDPLFQVSLNDFIPEMETKYDIDSIQQRHT